MVDAAGKIISKMPCEEVLQIWRANSGEPGGWYGWGSRDSYTSRVVRYISRNVRPHLSFFHLQERFLKQGKAWCPDRHRTRAATFHHKKNNDSCKFYPQCCEHYPTAKIASEKP